MQKARGFTLIEMMVVVTIIGILTAIAIPGYQRYIEKARIVDAQSDLTKQNQFLARWYAQKGAFDGAKLLTLSNKFYTYSFFLAPSAANDKYTIMAKPTTSNSSKKHIFVGENGRFTICDDAAKSVNCSTL